MKQRGTKEFWPIEGGKCGASVAVCKWYSYAAALRVKTSTTARKM